MKIGHTVILDRIRRLAPEIGKDVEKLRIHTAQGRMFEARQVYFEGSHTAAGATTFESGGSWITMINEDIVAIEVTLKEGLDLGKKVDLTLANYLVYLAKK